MVININTGRIVAKKLHHARNFRQRLAGLIPYRQLPDGEGILLTPCNSVHTFFMRFPIDVAYLDRELRVLSVHANVKPWRVLLARRKAFHVLETAAGVMATAGIEPGHKLQIRSSGNNRQF